MKWYIKSTTSQPQHFDIVVEIEYDNAQEVAAATYKGYTLPDGKVISGLPDVVLDSQALADYESFIESVQDLITDYYKLKIYYKNQSEDHSYYFGMVTKDDKGNIVLDFDFTLRLSNHPAHRSSQSQQHKKERKAALKEVTKGKPTKPITKSIIVNDNEYKSYEDAFIYIDEVIGNVVNILTKKLK